MFFYDDGLRILELDLAVDARQRQPRGFISHAHFDHLAPHELAFCTPATARFYRSRVGGERLVHELPFREPFLWNDHRLTTFPAGHILGSAMLLVESPASKLLYTGDFRLRPAATAESADPPRADCLVIEATFGLPRYRMPPRKQAIDQLTGILHTSIRAGRVPVIFAYVLGKAQEITRLLVDAGFRVRQHPAVYRLSRDYEAAGCPLGREHYGPYNGDGEGGGGESDDRYGERGEVVTRPLAQASTGASGQQTASESESGTAPLSTSASAPQSAPGTAPPSTSASAPQSASESATRSASDLASATASRPEVLVFPPPGHRWGGPALPANCVTIAVTGWSIDPAYRFKAGVDYAVPFSDHADFDELLECVERVAPRQIYCWHGQFRFVDELRSRGWDAHWLPSVRRPRPLTRLRQSRLF